MTISISEPSSVPVTVAASRTRRRPTRVGEHRGVVGQVRPPTIRAITLHAVLMVVGLFYLLPLFYMVLRSVTATSRLGSGFTLDHFRELDEKMEVWRLVWNTTVVTACRVVLQLALSVTAGFAIAQLRFAGRRFAFVGLVGCLMAPFSLMLIPLMVMVRGAGFHNSYVGLVAPTLVSGLGVLLFVQSFRRLPADLVSAARVDGCGPWRVMWHVAIPYFRSTIAAFALLVAIYSWNEFLWANVVTTGTDRRVLTVGVVRLANQNGWTDPGLQMAAACTAALPIVFVVVVFRRWAAIANDREFR